MYNKRSNNRANTQPLDVSAANPTGESFLIPDWNVAGDLCI